MAKEVKYESVAARFIVERDAKQLLAILIAIMEDLHPGFFEEGVNKLFPQASGEPYAASYTKPQ